MCEYAIWQGFSYSQEGCLDATEPKRKPQSITCFVEPLNRRTHIVYIMTPRGSRKQAAGVGTPSEISFGPAAVIYLMPTGKCVESSASAS
jgi:hypothetical protein